MSNPLGTGVIDNFRSDYDTRFTTDISKQMQMPDRLGAISTIYDAYMPPVDPLKDSTIPSLGMDCSMFSEQGLNCLPFSRATSERFMLLQLQRMRFVYIVQHR